MLERDAMQNRDTVDGVGESHGTTVEPHRFAVGKHDVAGDRIAHRRSAEGDRSSRQVPRGSIGMASVDGVRPQQMVQR